MQPWWIVPVPFLGPTFHCCDSYHSPLRSNLSGVHIAKILTADSTGRLQTGGIVAAETGNPSQDGFGARSPPKSSQVTTANNERQKFDEL